MAFKWHTRCTSVCQSYRILYLSTLQDFTIKAATEGPGAFPNSGLICQTLVMSVSKCCITGFEWEGEPTGRIVPFPTTSNQAYVTGSSSSAAILFICDLFGWEFRNNRLLADHLAQAVGATVYVPDL